MQTRVPLFANETPNIQQKYDSAPNNKLELVKSIVTICIKWLIAGLIIGLLFLIGTFNLSYSIQMTGYALILISATLSVFISVFNVGKFGPGVWPCYREEIMSEVRTNQNVLYSSILTPLLGIVIGFILVLI